LSLGAAVFRRAFSRKTGVPLAIDDIGGPTVIQIVPRYAAQSDGLAGHASALARALNDRGMHTVFLSANPPREIALNGLSEAIFVRRKRARFLRRVISSKSGILDVRAVILHYSGYGYQKRGVPLWLDHGLHAWKRREKKIPLITIFHELYAIGRPWQSSFWLSPLQKKIVRSILTLSSAAITSTTLYKNRLTQFDVRIPEIVCMPVFSNIGEPGYGRPPFARPAAAVIFGLAGVEDHLYGVYRKNIERIVSIMRIDEIFDVGPRLYAVPEGLASRPVVSKGILPTQEVSDLLAKCRVGFVAYPLDFLAKSGVFAAFAAHGVVPIVFSEKAGNFDGLEPGRHFIDGLRLPSEITFEELLVTVQRNLSAWYNSHSVKIHATITKSFIDRGQT
jgi:hypothetical protein